MPSVSHLHSPVAESARQPLRLRLRPNASRMDVFDGAWWPRSTDPVAEFPALVAGLTIHMGKVERIAFNLSSWAEAPARMTVDGRKVSLDGFHSLDQRTVLVSILDKGRIHLLVIAPDADENDVDAAWETTLGSRADGPVRSRVLFGQSNVDIPVARRVYQS